MSTNKESRSRQIRLLVFAVIAVALFNIVARKFGVMHFTLSTIQVMMLVVGVFTFAIVLVLWQIVNPLVRIAGEAGKALHGQGYHKVSLRDHVEELDNINEFLGCVVACTNKDKLKKLGKKKK